MRTQKEAEIEERILELGHLVALLRDRDRELRVFGADKRGGHQYLFRPPSTEMHLAEFEAKHQIALPSEYRLFLALVRNGEAGPHYGLMPLEEAARNHDLHAAFLWTSEVTLQSRGDPNLALWLTYPGILRLSHHGCGNYDFLVVRIEAEERLIPKSASFIPSNPISDIAVRHENAPCHPSSRPAVTQKSDGGGAEKSEGGRLGKGSDRHVVDHSPDAASRVRVLGSE